MFAILTLTVEQSLVLIFSTFRPLFPLWRVHNNDKPLYEVLICRAWFL